MAKTPLVDQRPLQTAQRMAAMAGTQEEQTLAHAAEKTGDHEVDLTFFDRLREVQLNPPPLSPEAKQIVARKNKAQQALKEDQDNVTLLTRKLTAAPDSQKDNLQDQIDVAKAQMELDQDEFDDASEDLEQAGGDPQAKIKRIQEQHEATGHNAAPAGSAVNPHEQDYQARTLVERLSGLAGSAREEIPSTAGGERSDRKRNSTWFSSAPNSRSRSRRIKRRARPPNNKPRDFPRAIP